MENRIYILVVKEKCITKYEGYVLGERGVKIRGEEFRVFVKHREREKKRGIS